MTKSRWISPSSVPIRNWDAWTSWSTTPGIVRDKAIWNMTVDDFDLVMRVHVRGSWLTSRAVARKWRAESKESGGKVYGRIINTTSGAGLHGHFGQTNYSAAKAAIVGLTQTLSLELASIGATVNAISPGGRTRMSAPCPARRRRSNPTSARRTSSTPRILRSGRRWWHGWRARRPATSAARSSGRWASTCSCSRAGAGRHGIQRRKAWDADKLGPILATDVFGTRNPGLRLGG